MWKPRGQTSDGQDSAAFVNGTKKGRSPAMARRMGLDIRAKDFLGAPHLKVISMAAVGFYAFLAALAQEIDGGALVLRGKGLTLAEIAALCGRDIADAGG